MNKDNHNDFENQGWEAMLQSLDREMPVENKRRRFLWLAFFIGLTTSIGGGFWYLNTKSPVKELDKTIAKPIAGIDLSKNTEGDKIVGFNENNKIIVNINTDNNNENLSLVENNKTINNTIIGDNKTSLISIKNNVNIDNEIIGTNKNNLSLIENKKAIDNTIIDNNKIDLNLIKNNKTIDSKITDNKDNNLSLIENNNNFKSIELLKKIKTTPLSIKQDSSELKYVYSYLHPFICFAGNTALVSKTRLGVTTGIHTEKGQKIDGFQVGLVVNQTLNHRWSIGSGLNFRQTQTIGDSISYFKKEYLANASGTNNLQSGKPISLDKLYYLELPLTIQYHFKKKFAFSTGIKTAYLVGQSVKENGTSVYFVSSSFNSLDNKTFLSQVNTTTLGLNRWDFSLIGDFSYLPTKHIQLGLRYDLGLKNIINRTNWSAYNRYLGLNVTYLF